MPKLISLSVVETPCSISVWLKRHYVGNLFSQELSHFSTSKYVISSLRIFFKMGHWKLIVWGKGPKLGSHDVRYINHSQTFHSNYSFQKFILLDPPKTVMKYIFLPDIYFSIFLTQLTEKLKDVPYAYQHDKENKSDWKWYFHSYAAGPTTLIEPLNNAS